MFVFAWMACDGGLEREPDDTTTLPVTSVPGDDLPPEGPAVVEAYLAGRISELPAFDGIADVSGAAVLERKVDGTAYLSFGATGLSPGVEHTAHVHTWPCYYEAGTHYMYDPSLPEAGEPNEVWVTFTPDADGGATAYADIAYGVRGDALSLVIHDPVTTDKLACADLLPEQLLGAKATGTFSPFALYEPVDETIGGTAELVMSASSSVKVSLSGLQPAESYAAHVHVYPCDTLDGGGHYKLDPSEIDTLAENEIWPTITVGPDGSADYTSTITGHTVREDAAAVVIHRIAGAEVPKVACADLKREAYLPLTTYGQFAAPLAGSATLDRRLDGATVLSLELGGLSPNATYEATLHTLPCAIQQGGPAYYYQDTESLYASLVAQANGSASRAVGVLWTARAEGQSVVLTDSADAYVACVDLQ